MARRYWYDTEFIEDGTTIDLISIGIVADDGREYYAVNSDAPWDRIEAHAWLMENVVPHLVSGAGGLNEPYYTKAKIAMDVREFLLRPNEGVELWGYYSAYDHVLLAQLFGPMIALPKGIPMWTNDVQQLAHAAGLDNSLPAQVGTAHNALDDARWTKTAWEYLDQRAKAGTQ